MTRYDAGHRLLDDIEKNHERALAKHETQIRLKDGYCDELELENTREREHVEIAAEWIAELLKSRHVEMSPVEIIRSISRKREARQAARKVAVT